MGKQQPEAGQRAAVILVHVLGRARMQLMQALQKLDSPSHTLVSQVNDYDQ